MIFEANFAAISSTQNNPTAISLVLMATAVRWWWTSIELFDVGVVLKLATILAVVFGDGVDIVEVCGERWWL